MLNPKIYKFRRNKNFEDLKFVLKARKFGAIVLPFLCLVCVSDGKIICSDGSRMHIIKNKFNLSDGLYSVLKNIEREIWLELYEGDLKFPNWKLVLPQIDFNGYVQKVSKNIIIDSNYIIDLYDIHYDVYHNGNKTAPVLFYNDERQAVIMPMLEKRRKK